MARALELAQRGVGRVEPNPPVGAVLVDERLQLLGEGWHDQFGGPHAEIHALQQAGSLPENATLFVTLEPCCHRGKTGPCTEALLQAGVRHVVVGTPDPHPQVSGKGIAALRAAGVTVEVGLLQSECQRLIAPFTKWATTGLPWVHAKWAMTLDGKLASRTGHSQWISNEASREVVHRLRGRMDALLIGAETAARDDPLLTARPPGPRTAVRGVISRSARLSPSSQLARTAGEIPVFVTRQEDPATRPGEFAAASLDALRRCGVEILTLSAAPRPTGISAAASAGEGPGNLPPRLTPAALKELLRLLGERGMTHVLVEGGGHLLGSFHDAGLIDEVHVFIAPKILGGAGAVSPLLGKGRASVPEQADLESVTVETLDGDVYIHGFVHHPGDKEDRPD